MVRVTSVIAVFLCIHKVNCINNRDEPIQPNVIEQDEIPSTISRRLVPSSPEDVGFGHTTIIHNLQQRMEMNFPKTQKQYLQAVAVEVGEHLCDSTDFECKGRILQNTFDLKVGPQGKAESGIEHLKINLLPNDFDPMVMESLEKLFFTISLADLNEDLVDVLSIMNKDFEELKARVDVNNEAHRTVGLVSYAVGMESAKQWHEIFNDEENPFLRFVQQHKPKSRKRRLQALGNAFGLLGDVFSGVVQGGVGSTIGDTQLGDSLGIESAIPPQPDPDADIDFAKLLEADAIGVSAGLITSGFDTVGGNGTDVLSTLLEQASLASAKQIVEDLSGDPVECRLPPILCPRPNSTLDPGNPQGCKYPDSPYCNTTVPNPGDPVDPDGCLFPGSEFC